MPPNSGLYRDTLALWTNPFGPSFDLKPEEMTKLEFMADLDVSPLRLDQCPELRALFCDTILGLQEHFAEFRDLMIERGYDFEGSGKRGMNSAVVVVRGAQGSGKTTLASWMVAEVSRLDGPKPWATFLMDEPANSTRDAFQAALKDLGHEIERESVPGQHLAVMIEDVRSETIGDAIKMFERLKSRPRLFVLTTHDLRLLDADARTLGGSAIIRTFTLSSVSAADADRYVEHRVAHFRDPNRPEILTVSPVFPFIPGMAGQKVIQRAPGGEEGTITLRVLNAQLGNRLTEHAQQLRAASRPPVENAPPEDLPGYLLPDL